MPPKRAATGSPIPDESTTIATRRSQKVPKGSASDSGKISAIKVENAHDAQSSYEDIRRRNIAKIQLEMQHIGLSAAAAAFVPISNPSSARSSNSAASRGKKSASAAEPLRMSLRARDGETKPKRDIYSEAAFEIQEQRERMQRRTAPFSVEDSWFKDLSSSDHECRTLSDGVFAALRRPSIAKSSNPKFAAAAEVYGRMRAHSSGYGKLVPDRIYSICMHPSRESIIGFVGDKFGKALPRFRVLVHAIARLISPTGKLGIVNYGAAHDVIKRSSTPFADADSEFAQRRVCLEAHKETISCIAFPRSVKGSGAGGADPTASSVFTSSYDGSIRALDIDRAMFSDVAVRAEDDEYLVHSIRFIDSCTLWYSTSDGDIRLADVRLSAADNSKLPVHVVHKKKVGCVDVKDATTLLTASNDATIALWDSRYMKKTPSAIDTFSSSCTMQCAYFSPSGDTIVAQNARDTNFLFFEGSTSTFAGAGFNASAALRLPHNNNTGRFTSTFRSVWDPKYDRVFCIGSMDQPRGFDVFGADYSFSKPASLTFRTKVAGPLVTNVPASLAPHPSLPVLFGGNSSGRVTLFVSP